MIGAPGLIAMVGFVFFLATALGVGAWTSTAIVNVQIGREAVERLVPVARATWDTAMAAQVQANSAAIDGPFTAPANIQNFALCDAANPACGITANVAYTVDSNGGGGLSETVNAVQRAAAPTPNPFGPAPATCTAAEGGGALGHFVITVHNSGGGIMATRGFTISSRTICHAPYIAGGAVTDDSARDLVGSDGNVRTAGRSGGCTASNPLDCDSLTASIGAATASDTRVHAALQCAGIHCTGADGLQNIDNFHQQTITNARVSGVRP